MSSEDSRRLLLRYAVDLLSRQSYFRSKLTQKLNLRAQKLNLADSKEVIAGILVSLEKDGFLNDRSLGESFARRELGKCYGPRLIAYKLTHLGFSASEAKDIVATLDPAEIEAVALRYLHKKHIDDPRKMSFVLYSRGFSNIKAQNAFDVDDF